MMTAPYFRDGAYHGYEVRLTLDRNGGHPEPYRIRNSRDVLKFMRPLADQSAEHYYSLNLGGSEMVHGVYLAS